MNHSFDMPLASSGTTLPPARPALPGVLGQITARAEVRSTRLALTTPWPTANCRSARKTSTTRSRRTTTPPAALNGTTGHPRAEQSHAAVEAHPARLTRSQICDTLDHNQPHNSGSSGIDVVRVRAESGC
jgi:hypothetical protein